MFALVTGVQTCALPICRVARPHERRLPPHHAFHHPTGRPQMIHALRHGARRAMLIASASMIALTFAVPAHAGGSSMPWEAPLQSILESIEGPVAKIVAVIIIIVTRSEERRVGKDGFSTCRSLWSP